MEELQSTKQNESGKKTRHGSSDRREVEDRNCPSETAAPDGAALPPTNNGGVLGKAGVARNCNFPSATSIHAARADGRGRLLQPVDGVACCRAQCVYSSIRATKGSESVEWSECERVCASRQAFGKETQICKQRVSQCPEIGSVLFTVLAAHHPFQNKIQ